MRIVLFASPGLLGPYTLMTLLQSNVTVALLVLPTSQYAVSASEMIAMAQRAEIPMTAPLSLKNAEFIDAVRRADADAILVATFDKRIPKEVVDLPRLGAFNVHPSWLPLYRGACPEFWAIRNGETETGISIHTVTEEFDAGNIVMQERLPIEETDTVGSLLYRMIPVVSKMIVQFLERLRTEDALTGVPQDHSVATQAPLVTEHDLRISWDQSTTSLYNLVRAANPVGGAWTMFRGFQMKVWHATKAVHAPRTAVALQPGAMVRDAATKSLFVRTAEGFLVVQVVQPALYYIIDGWALAERTSIEDGELLGQSQ